MPTARHDRTAALLALLALTASCAEAQAATQELHLSTQPNWANPLEVDPMATTIADSGNNTAPAVAFVVRKDGRLVSTR